mgnify:CR=1 FL=1
MEPTVDGGSLPIQDAGRDSSSDAGTMVSDAGDASSDAGDASGDAGGGAGPGCMRWCAANVAERSDGTLWIYGTNVSWSPSVAPVELLQAPGGGPVVAATSPRSFGVAGVASGTLCAIESGGTVLCGPEGSGLSQIYATGGIPLAGAVAVSVDPENGVFCAIDSTSALWCWGDGQYGALGQGTTNSSTYALPVVVQVRGATQPFTGVSRVAATRQHVCAVKTDGTVWCWGSNTAGAVGVGSTQTQFLYPTQVVALSNVVDVVGEGDNACALKSDGTVWCWGENTNGSVGNGTASPMAASPSQVLTGGDAGAPLSGASAILMFGQGSRMAACASRSADHSIWCWGSGFTNVAAQQSEGGQPIANASLLGTFACYLDESGALNLLEGATYGGNFAETNPVACPATGPSDAGADATGSD